VDGDDNGYFKTEERGISTDYEYVRNKSWIKLIFGQRREVITKDKIYT